MVMLDFFVQAKLSVAVAHIDHLTRAGQSTKDAAFVASHCASLGLRCYTTTFDIDQAEQHNFQAAARAFRYAYLEELCRIHDYTYICTAHHKNDRLETLLMNIGRSSGLAGITSLRYLEGDHLLRPLLPYSREQLEAYARQHNVPYMHDVSNDGDDYDRNKIRHSVIPALLSIYPHYVEAASNTSDHLQAESEILEYYLSRDELVTTHNGIATINLSQINTMPQAQTVLYKLLKDRGFTYSDSGDMLRSTQAGSRFLSLTHEATLNKAALSVRPIDAGLGEWKVNIETLGIYELEHVRVEVSESTTELTEPLPFATIKLPLEMVEKGICLRSPLPGDHIKPWHFQGRSKKLKKIMADEKLSIFEKEKVVVVTNMEKEVVCIVTPLKAYLHKKPDGDLPTCTIRVFTTS